MTGRIDFFKSKNVSWKGRAIRLRRARWHSCQMWGWDSLNRGEHLIEWHDYWVLSIRVGTRGVCWQYFPYKASFR